MIEKQQKAVEKAKKEVKCGKAQKNNQQMLSFSTVNITKRSGLTSSLFPCICSIISAVMKGTVK